MSRPSAGQAAAGAGRRRPNQRVGLGERFSEGRRLFFVEGVGDALQVLAVLVAGAVEIFLLLDI